MYYLLYKEMSFLATLAFSVRRSGTNNLDCFGRVGYISDVKQHKYMGTHVFLGKHLIVLLIPSIRINCLLPYRQSVVPFSTLTSKNAIFICLGEISFFRL